MSYFLLIAYTVVIAGIALKWGAYRERNRLAKIREASFRTRHFRPSSTPITFN